MQSKKLVKPLFPPLPPLSEEEARRNVAQYQHEHRNDCLPFIGFIRCCSVVCGLFFGFLAYDHFTQKPFNSVQWKRAAKEDRLSDRAVMAEDLVYGDMLVGLNRSQMMALLGKPDQEPVRNWDAGYALGDSPMSINVTMLLVKFDGQKRISDYEVLSLD